MSVSKLPGTRGYLVRWRDSAGASRSKTVLRQRDAFNLDGEMKRRRSTGELVTHERGNETLRDFWTTYWSTYAIVALTARTRETYEIVWRVHIAPKLGHRKLRSITHEQVAHFVSGLSTGSAPATVAKIHTVLRSVLQRAVEWQRIPLNPAAGVKKPPVESRRGWALSIFQTEALAAELDLRSAMISIVLVETGLRPGELRGLRWYDLQTVGALVERSISKDAVSPTKTRRKRRVELSTAARSALREWFLACGKPAPGAYVFPSPRGGVWTDAGWNIWAKRKFAPAASRAGLKGLVPYDLRHTFVSRKIDAGRDIYWIARQTGHSPAVMLGTYAHLIGGESVVSEGHANLTTEQILRALGET